METPFVASLRKEEKYEEEEEEEEEFSPQVNVQQSVSLPHLTLAFVKKLWRNLYRSNDLRLSITRSMNTVNSILLHPTSLV